MQAAGATNYERATAGPLLGSMLAGRSPSLCDPQLAVCAHKIILRDPMKVGQKEWGGE
jgi:hypothetical protein